MQSAARLLFVVCACLAFAMAVVPDPIQVPAASSDKIKHGLAFATLGALAAYGFATTSVLRLFAALAAFGALIELVQAIPALHRDSEIVDLLVDMGAALPALVAARWIAVRLQQSSS